MCNKMYLGANLWSVSFSVCFCFLATIFCRFIMLLVGQLRPLKTGCICSHSSYPDYSFSCVLCGYFPPLVNLDVDKKGVFELAGEKS